MSNRIRVAVCFAALLLCGRLSAQQTEVVYSDDFQSYGTQANPAGWIDTSIGKPKPQAEGLYKTWPDPLQGANVVYGTKQSSGKPEGNNPRIGTFSTLTTKSFSTNGRFEYRGRFLRTNDDTHIGLSFLSSYPESDRYYLIGLWSGTMQLFGFGAGAIGGTTDSGVTPEINKWYRFLIQVDDVESATKIRARFWLDGADEPSAFTIDASDASATRLTSGRIGIWSAVRGAAYVDDLFAKSPVDHTPPEITFFESGVQIPADTITPIGHDARIDVRATDDLSGVASITTTVDGQPYTLLDPIAAEGSHTIHARAVDHVGNASESETRVVVDKTEPLVAIVENGQPLVSGATFNRDVRPEAVIQDLTATTVVATLNEAPFVIGTTIVAEGIYRLGVTVTDAVGHVNTLPVVTFTIDKTPPALSFTNPVANAVLTAPRVVVAGGADDAVSVQVNGVAASIDANARTFVTPVAIELLEGDNTLTAIGIDRAGNTSTVAITVRLDTRAPELTITSPSANACLDATEVQVSGTVSDAALAEVRVSGVVATLSADRRSFTATVPTPDEGKIVIRIDAVDASGHTSSATIPVAIDRTKPALQVTEGGAPFTTSILARPVALYVRATDADPSPALDVTLDGQPYANGTAITAEGAHELRAKATDCAGHVSDELVRSFTIDRTPPSLVSINPSNGSVTGTRSAISGVLSEIATVVDEATGRAATVNGVDFSLDVLEDGLNSRVLVLTDPAKNETRVPYSVTVDTSAPSVEIVEGGEPIPANALFNRAVTPVIRTNDSRATIIATINGAPFTSGTTITADGEYAIAAKVRDAIGNESSTATAAFRIDRTAPAVTITSPASGAVVDAESIEVRGTATGNDIASVTVNGIPATLTGTAFTATITIDLGANVITALAIDRANNAASATVEIVRGRGAVGILLTSPPDNLLTNRPTVVVAGQVLSASAAENLTINGVETPLDPAGNFRRNDFPLTEGENVITATVTAASGPPNSIAARVTADFTAPVLDVLANGTSLSDGARFASSPSIALQSTETLVRTLTIDGEVVDGGVVSLQQGGHALTATARDAAGNETRVDRVFFIGDATSAAGCALASFEPADDTSVFSETVRITGRSGGAIGVSINGNAASVADGSFCGDATLAPGRNEVTIQCTDASGQPTSDEPVKLVLYRYSDPSITITSPAPQSLVTTDKVTVTGTVGEGVTSGDVNGIAFTPALSGVEGAEGSNAFSVPDVPVNAGLNVIIARAKTSSSRVAATSVHVRVAGAPQIAITSPLAGSATGSQSIDVSGTYANVDPSTITVNGAAATVRALSDTSGTFIATGVQLAPGASSTITATGRNSANAQASASVAVLHVATAPAIAITSPADNTYFASTHSGPVRVTGTFSGEDGTQVQVNGAFATVAGGTFSADVEIASGINPIVARAITPDGRSASDAVRVVRLAAPLTVKESFPAADATGVDPGIAVVVLFSNALDKTSVASAVRVNDATGTQLDGELFVDRDAITFAPAQPLRSGQRYTVAISQSLVDAAGAAMAAAHSFTFTVATSAPSTAPILDETTTTGCFNGATITGRVSTPGARVRLDIDGVTMTTVSNETGAFRFTFSFSGQTGYHLARVREIGSDGTLSAERALCYRINCAIPQVVSASLDRAAKTITIQFSKAMDGGSVDAAIIVTLSGVEGAPSLERTVSVANDIATVTLASVPDETITLTVTKTAKDTTGASMAADFTQSFPLQTDPTLGHGDGYITGAIYDATNGRPLEGAAVRILDSILTTNTRGRYSRALPEGAYTLEASAPGQTTVWRQVVVPAGAGVVPIDIRLTKRGAESVLIHGGDTKITKRVELASLPSGRTVRLTSVGNQSLAGLLPLGWSPLAAAEVVADAPDLAGAKLTFVIDAAAVIAATQTLSLVQYDSERDEWRVVVAVANVPSDGRVQFDITSAGNYALVYPDDGAPPARTGATLAGVPNPCIATPDVCKVVGQSFVLEPKAVLPSGRTVATLTTDGTKPYPSGTAVQAFIDEQLNLADGRVLVDPPFATDLLIYRTLDGNAGVADFHLSPSAQAAGVILRDGVDHIRIVDYPGRIDRGTLIGAEGGRVPGDDRVTIDIPAGATSEPLHASVASISDLAQFGSIAGFQVVAGFTFTLTRTNEPQLPEGVTASPVQLLTPARATFSVASTSQQIVVAEVLDNTPYGVLYHLAALTSPTNFAGVVSTRVIDSTQLPLDGIVRDGRYLVLVADAPIAFAYGQVRSTIAIANARVTADSLGVRDLSRIDGLFVVPVTAKPATPFTLVPRSIAAGDGATYVSPSSPDPDTFVNIGVLPLAAQPPRLLSVTPADGAQVDAGAVVVQATFDVSIDAASIAGSIRVTNLTTNAVVGGATVANGPTTIRFNSTEPLSAGSRYSIGIGPEIRSSTGTPFGRTAISHFTTRALPSNSTIRPDLIQITIPDANGKSTITGRPGALPTGASAVAVRRGRSFIESYQAVAAGDGSFSFEAGHLHANDRISTSDAIDLQVLDAVSKAIIAVIELTPFVSSDGRGFIAPPDRETRFLSADDIRVIVPAGAFEEPTFISVAPAAKEAFAGVPSFDTELGYATSIRISFDGVAKKPLDVEMPIPAGFNASGRDWLLGYLGDSVRGPRVAIADIVHVDGTMFKTGPAPSTPGARRVATNAAIFGAELRQYMMRLQRSGIYATVDLQVGGMAAGFIQGLQAGFDLFWDFMASTYAPYEYLVEKNYKIVIPVPVGKPFTIVGVDAATGLDAFTKVYDPIAPGTSTVELPNPDPDRIGPHPVFGTPFRIETMDVHVADVALTSIRDFTIELRNGSIAAETTLAPEIEVTMLNVTKGLVAHRSGGLKVEGAVGDRIVLVIGQRDVDPYSPLSITFNEPLNVELDAFIRVEMRSSAGQGTFAEIGDALRLTANSNGRRVEIAMPASLTRGAEYRIAISKDLADGSGLKIAQIRDADGNVSDGLAEDLYLYFRVREPGDKRTSFDLDRGIIRDQALNGNVLFVSAFDGGIVAYDVSNPAAMGESTLPIGRSAGGANEYWAVTTDHHGRVYATAVNGLFGVINAFRLEDFLPATAGTIAEAPIRGSGVVSWVPGAAFAMAIDSRVIAGDRPEAIPRKLQILVQDQQDNFENRDAFKQYSGVTQTSATGELAVFTLEIGRDAGLAYLTQRITVENMTLDMRWSGNATATAPARITGIVARAGDRLRIIRNQTTHGVVALFGYGIGVFDLNAMESNDDPSRSQFGLIKELVHLTNGSLPLEGFCDPLPADAIPDLTYTPDATIVTRPGSPDLHVLALDTARGVLDLAIDPSNEETTSCDARGRLGLRFRNVYTEGTPPVFNEYDHPRLKHLREEFKKISGRFPTARFTGAARHRWTLSADKNLTGERASEPRKDVSRDYMLIPGQEYGLLVVEIGGDPGPVSAPIYRPLSPFHLVDVIWIPHGAYAVRTIPGRDLAVVVDGEKRVLLVDLKRIDERWGIGETDLFPTVASVLAKGVETPDPRIVWRSENALATGTLAPVVDPDTGFVYAGKLLEKATNVVAALDPQMRAEDANGVLELRGLVPAGFDAPPGVDAAASLSSFRLSVTMPGGIAGGNFRVNVESELVPGVKAPDTDAGLPRAHLMSLPMQRIVPADMPELRYQKGYNKWVSPWIVTIGDPRASEKFIGSADAKQMSGCDTCARPQQLQRKTEADGVYELWSAGRSITVRPDAAVLNGTGYEYLNTANRFHMRLATTPGRKVRAKEVLVAAHNPPVADGLLQETTYLHSGELESSAVDLDAGGRAGWNVVIARKYRSRTIGETPLGEGWDSPMFRFLLPLPNGKEVEYHDGAGEIWRFKQLEVKPDTYKAQGLFLRLVRTANGWNLIDQKWRITKFDESGRLVSESDEFADAAQTKGNTIRYGYDSEGRLAVMVDPVGRKTNLTYYTETGLLKDVTDWRERVVTYGYDTQRRLTSVTLPDVQNQFATGPNATGVFKGRPEIRYDYEQISAPSSGEPLQSQPYTDYAELRGNLKTITDPAEVASGGNPRVEFFYDLTTAAQRRDRVLAQKWATGEAASFDYRSTTNTVVVDALAQAREYELTSPGSHDGRQHVSQRVEKSVPTTLFEGELPASAPADLSPALKDHVTAIGYTGDGQTDFVTYPSGRRDDFGYKTALNGTAGTVLTTITTTGPNTSTTETHFRYETRPNAANTILEIGRKDAVTEDNGGPVYRDAQSPSRERTETVRTEEAVTYKTKWNESGQPFAGEVLDANGTLHQTSTTNYHGIAGTNQNERARPSEVVSGANDLLETVTFVSAPDGGEKVERRDSVRQIVTEEQYDARDQLIHRVVKNAIGEVVSEESFGYDASGRLSYQAREQKGVDLVESTTTYDALGRALLTTMTKAVVNGLVTTIQTRAEYDLANSRITTFDPYTSAEEIKTTATLDGLGRTAKSERQAMAGGDIIRSAVGYDFTGQISWESDTVRTAVARRHDVFGRGITAVASDGISSETKWNAWSEATDQLTRGANGEPIARSHNIYTRKGRLRATNEEITNLGAARQTRFHWADGDRLMSTRVAQVADIATPNLPSGMYRTREVKRDAAGRITDEIVGEAEGISGSVTQAWAKTSYGYVGNAPNIVTASEPRVGAIYPSTAAFDALGRLSEITESGGFTTDPDYDEAGNLVSLTRPGMDEETASYDSRGLATTRTLPDGKTKQFLYDVRGMLREHRDEESRATKYTPDSLGRLTKIEYEDGTFEEVRYENVTGLVRARRDRAGQWLSFVYDSGVRVKEIHAGEDPASAPLVVKYDYDAAGRLVLMKNKHAAIEYSDYDLLGRPHTTRTYRYFGGTGLDDTPPIDVHTQKHDWTIHDERSSWTMPVAGMTVPADDTSSGWLRTIIQTFDGGGNLAKQTTPDGAVLSQSDGRSVGRISLRRRTTATGASLATSFVYTDGVRRPSDRELPGGGTPPVATGLLEESRTSIGNATRAGGKTTYDAARRVKTVNDLATTRLSMWGYDLRGRLSTSLLGASTPSATSMTEGITSADFRELRSSSSLLTATQRNDLESEALKIEPPKWTATQNAGHQITSRTLYLDDVAQTPLTFDFEGGRRTSDGVWKYTFDELGRMTSAERVAASGEENRRVELEWDPNNRMIGRTAYEPDGAGGWRVETRGSVVARDGLPAEATFVWDPLADRLVSVFEKGASTQQNAPPTAGLVRQYLHGDQSYDDPTEVRIADAGGTPRRFFPVVDHAGTGSLTATIGADGNLIERVLYADSYGDAPRYVHGPVIDAITIEAQGTSAGAEVKVSVHSSEPLDAATVAAGARLASVRADKTIVYQTNVSASLEDEHTMLWTLSPIEWSALANAIGADRLEIAITDALRAEGWGDAHVQNLPSWTFKVYGGTESTAALPVVKRESLADMRAFAEAVGTSGNDSRTLYELSSLYLAASTESKAKLLTGFQAAPFVEPATGLVYVRNRWYDPSTGTFLTPDPLGYVDSSNLYAFAGGDPVNRRDPTGERAPTAEESARIAAMKERAVQLEYDWEDNGYAVIDVWSYRQVLSISRRGTPSRWEWTEVPYIIETQYQYENALKMLWDDAFDYERRIAEADEAEEVDPAPLSKRRLMNAQIVLGTVRVAGAAMSMLGARGNRGVSAQVYGRRVKRSASTGKGAYRNVGGHHIHAKKAFAGHVSYDPKSGFSISQEYMRSRGWRHEVMTAMQQRLFRQLAASGRPNTLKEHTRIAIESLKAAGATDAEARSLAAESLINLRLQGVRQPTRVPWVK